MRNFKRVISTLLLTPILFGSFISCSKQGNEAGNDNQSKTLTVIAATAELKRGDTISKKNITTVEADIADIPENYLTTIEEAVGRTVLVDINAGEYLCEDVLAEKTDPNVLKKEDLDQIQKNLTAKIRNQLLEELQHEIASGGINAADLGYVVVTDYVRANTGEDVSDEIQKVIDSNPRKTIFFPDGEYILGKPICTSANPQRAVSLRLSDFAILKASDDWSDDEAMVRLGASEHYNTIHETGSNYSFVGGVINGNNVANGISIESGRETSIRNVSIKFTQIGLHIKKGANGNSSDADIDSVNIVGNNKKGSVGVLLVGFDNTLTNMRIASVERGMLITGSGNFLRNIHSLMIYSNDYAYEDSIAFDDQGGGTWYDICYSDNYAVGFKFHEKAINNYSNCFALWYDGKVSMQVAFKCIGKMNAVISKCRGEMWGTSATSAYIQIDEADGGGMIENPIFNVLANKDDSYKDYLFGKVVWRKGVNM